MYFTAHQKFLLVGHTMPDSDCLSAIYVFLRAVNVSVADSRVSYFFVPPGKRLVALDDEKTKYYVSGDRKKKVVITVDRGTLVCHFDTGGETDPDNYIFDHHVVDSPYSSATDVVFQHFYEPDKCPRSLRSFVEYVNRVDSPRRHRILTQDEYAVISDLNDQLIEELGDVGRFVVKQPGPLHLAKTINHFSDFITDKMRVLLAYATIEAWFNQFKTLKAIDSLLIDMIPVKHNGVIFALVPPNSANTKSLRYHFNRNVNFVDVYVTGHLADDPNDDGRGKFNVTIVAGSWITGMQELRENLYALDPKLQPQSDEVDFADQDIFVHPSEFCLYVSSKKTDLTMETVLKVAMQTLRQMTEDEIAEAKRKIAARERATRERALHESAASPV